jgi:hypothetical protein
VIIICSWCKKCQGEKEPLDDKRTTHTICPVCLENQKLENQEYWQHNPPAAVSAAG